MPEICRFFGIIISLNYNDHPPPHFHVRYAEQQAIVAIDTLSVLEGTCRHGCWDSSLNGRWRTGKSCSRTGTSRATSSR